MLAAVFITATFEMKIYIVKTGKVVYYSKIGGGNVNANIKVSHLTGIRS